MDKSYIKFIIASDFGWIFEDMNLACDEAFELAEEIACRYSKYVTKNNKEEHYQSLHDYCETFSFRQVWKEMKEKVKNDD